MVIYISSNVNLKDEFSSGRGGGAGIFCDSLYINGFNLYYGFIKIIYTRNQEMFTTCMK